MIGYVGVHRGSLEVRSSEMICIRVNFLLSNHISDQACVIMVTVQLEFEANDSKPRRSKSFVSVLVIILTLMQSPG